MRDLTEELFSRLIPEKVWHYTSVDALEGIITSERMWATDARFTNDRSEFIHVREVAEECIARAGNNGALGGFPAANLQNMLDNAFEEGPLSPDRNQVYLICFSQARDLLTQWTQYASGGAGVSIAFDLRHIRPPNEPEIAVTFAPCLYAQAAKEQLVTSALSRWTSTVAEINRHSRDPRWVHEEVRTWKIIDRIYGVPFSDVEFHRVVAEKQAAYIRDSLFEAWKRTLFDLLRVASHCKDEAFFAEQEWRLALPRTADRPSTDNPIKYRGPRMNVPYFEFNMFHHGTLPIVEIMLGPLCREAERVEDIIQRKGYTCPITASRAPLQDPRTL